MITALLLGIGLVLVFEGLVLALAPSRIEDMLKVILDIPPETRRMIGLGALAIGTILVWIAKSVANF